jgi:AraC-like DNA-binding protein
MDSEADKLFAESVRESLRTAFTDHRCLTAQQCAAALTISVRSMQRRLQRIDLTFSAIADEIRFELASEQLLDSSDTIEEIGRVLGFSTQESFIRAFSRWSGMSPGEFRRRGDP